MAAAVVENLLSGVLDPDNVIKWLLYETGSLCSPEDKTCRIEFLPFYLNFIHEYFSTVNSNSDVSSSPNKLDISHRDSEPSDRENNAFQNPRRITLFSPEAESPNTNSNSNLNAPLNDSINLGTILKAHRKTAKTKVVTKHNLIAWDTPKRRDERDKKVFVPEEKFVAKSVPDFKDLDAFPPVDACKAKVRRITPTRLTPSPVKDPKVNKAFPTPFENQFHNASNFKTKQIFSSTPLKEKKDEIQTEARQWLREHLTTATNLESLSPAVNCTQSPAILDTKAPQLNMREPVPDVYIQPCISSVTQMDTLNAISKVYSVCLQESLVPNINTEMFFLIQLLTVKVKETANPSGNLVNVHNCVYFAVKVLEEQELLMSFFDISALNMVQGIPYLQEFSQTLYDKICHLQKNFDQGSSWKVSHVQGVAFQEHMDNRQNFPSDNSFGIFRRQRDMFYDLYRDWEKHNTTSGWTAQEMFLKRVNNIVKITSDPVNHVHLARLIVSQLVQSCCDCEELSLQGGVDEESLMELKQLFPEKFTKLHKRMLTPALQGDPSPPPSFQGSQGFFHDFLQTSNSAVLHKHIIDHLVVRIFEMNKTDAFDFEIQQDSEMQEQFFLTIHTLRLLGKFLGFLVFLPYRTKFTLPNEANMELRYLRSCDSFPINLEDIIQTALQKKRMILTIPWVVEYLSMVDSIALSLPYYQPVINTLIQIYYTSSQTISNPNSNLLLKLLLGWFFEQPEFPQSAFFKFHPQRPVVATKIPGCIDEANLVDQKLITSCCPYVREINCLLKNFLFGNKSSTKEVRKITPIAAEGNSYSGRSAQLYVQEKLEENFFHYQPASTKRTVDFVGDRVASRAIKNIGRVLIPKIKSQELDQLLIHPKLQNRLRADNLNGFISNRAVTLCHSVWEESSTFVKEFARNLVNQIIPLLLSEESSKVIQDTCGNVAFRIAVEKVLHWVRCNVTVEYFIGYLTEEVPRLFRAKESEVCMANNQSNNMVEIIDKIRQTTQILHTQKPVSKKELESILELVSDCSHYDAADMISKNLGYIYSDFFTMVVIKHPNYIDTEMKTDMLRILQQFPDPSGMHRLLCPRNVLILSQCKNPQVSWSKIQELIISMFEEKQILLEDFLTNCKMLSQTRLPQNILQPLRTCIAQILNKLSQDCSEESVEEIKKTLEHFKF